MVAQVRAFCTLQHVNLDSYQKINSCPMATSPELLSIGMERTPMSMKRKLLVAPVSFSAALFLAGCSANSVSTVKPNAQAAASLHGHLMGGQQPISGATIQLYAVGTGGDGSASTAMITTTTVTSGSDGSFSISGDYQCTNATTNFTATDVYLTAAGGDPTPGNANANLTLMAALGQCTTLNSGTDILMNELTSVAAVAALYPYMTSVTAIGSGTGDATALDQAFTLANEFVTVASGEAPGNVPAGYTDPVALINTLGDVIVPCVNSTSGSGGAPSSDCSTLFSLSMAGSVAPTETVGALLNIEKNPTQNTGMLWNQVGGVGAEFLPDLSYAPASWAIALIPDTTVSYSPSPYTFSNVTVGQSLSGTIYVVNTGRTNPLYVSGITITGAVNGNFSLGSTTCTSSSSQVSIAPGSFCTIGVAFSPSTTGAQTATVVVTSNSTTSPDSVILNGTGQ
jgi:hypothetical protein